MSERRTTNVPTLTKVPIKVFNQHQDLTAECWHFPIPYFTSFSHDNWGSGAKAKLQQKAISIYHPLPFHKGLGRPTSNKHQPTSACIHFSLLLFLSRPEPHSGLELKALEAVLCCACDGALAQAVRGCGFSSLDPFSSCLAIALGTLLWVAWLERGWARGTQRALTASASLWVCDSVKCLFGHLGSLYKSINCCQFYLWETAQNVLVHHTIFTNIT